MPALGVTHKSKSFIQCQQFRVLSAMPASARRSESGSNAMVPAIPGSLSNAGDGGLSGFFVALRGASNSGFSQQCRGRRGRGRRRRDAQCQQFRVLSAMPGWRASTRGRCPSRASNSGFSQQCRGSKRARLGGRALWCQQFRVLSAMPGAQRRVARVRIGRRCQQFRVLSAMPGRSSAPSPRRG